MTASRALAGALVMGVFTLLALAAVLLLRGFEGPALTGLWVGAGVGGFNVAVSALLLSWSLRRKPKIALIVSLGGFFARMIILLVLTWVFWHVPEVDAVSFAVSFVVFFFLFLVVEIVIVGRASTKGSCGSGASV